MGTRSATTSFKIDLTSTIKNRLNDGTEASVVVGGTIQQANWANGAEANQANRPIRYKGTITSGNTIDIDVYDFGSIDIGAGAGDDGVGQSWVCEEIVLIYIACTGGAGSLEIQPSAPANPLAWIAESTVSNGGALRSGGFVIQCNPDKDGLEVTDASSNVIRLGANGGDVDFDLLILGRSDDEVSSSSSSLSSSSSTTSSESSSRSSSSSTSSSSVSSVSSSTVSSNSSSSSSVSTLSSSSTS